ncbi:hypothetical protein ETB97_003864 [Aspergillus alliaceus]|uniref:Uncharacterized protein n=1 Tax=Petromyces alliaceus TaxID=209559 RepID=A0A8H5ZZH4_PETAA|nr:hypothetical protein ETB97_003864 [Aspergillus burnettii]
MKTIPTLLLTLTTSSLTKAWSFTWRDASNHPFIETSANFKPCTPIAQAQGKEFVYSGSDDSFSFYLWTNENCTGPPSGFTPPARWGKLASTDLRSYMVSYGDKDGPSSMAVSSSSSVTATATATATTTGGSTATATNLPGHGDGSGNKDGSSSVSGGAVAGIVIGVVAGVALLGGAFWLGRRYRGRSGSASGSGEGAAHGFGSVSGSGPGAGYVQPGTPIGGTEGSNGGYMGAEVTKPGLAYMYENHPMSPVPAYQPAAGPVFAELPGDSAVVEMSDTQRVNELDGSGKGGYR